MQHSETLVRHSDIQKWVTARHGMPAIARIPSLNGPARARLALRFARARRAMPPAIDDGVSPVSWKAWLAELDRQHLALKVSSQKTPDFEFVERQDASSGAPLN